MQRLLYRFKSQLSLECEQILEVADKVLNFYSGKESQHNLIGAIRKTFQILELFGGEIRFFTLLIVP